MNGEDANAGEDFPLFPSLLTCVGVIRLDGVTFLLRKEKNHQKLRIEVFTGCQCDFHADISPDSCLSLLAL